MPSPFPCSPVIRESFWKKTPIEKKKKKKFLRFLISQYIYNLVDLAHLITFFKLILFIHTIYNIGVYGLLYTLIYPL